MKYPLTIEQMRRCRLAHIEVEHGPEAGPAEVNMLIEQAVLQHSLFREVLTARRSLSTEAAQESGDVLARVEELLGDAYAQTITFHEAMVQIIAVALAGIEAASTQGDS